MKSFFSRVVAVEGKVNLMNKTYAADSVTVNNAIAKLKETTDELQAHDATTQNTLVQLQWALEAGHREATDNHAILKSRLDLLQHIQQQGPTADLEPAGVVPSKSIEIKFTTLGAEEEGGEESQEEEEEEAYESTTYTNPGAGAGAGVSFSRNLSSLQPNVSLASSASPLAQVNNRAVEQPISAPAPAASKPAQRGGYSAFLTEPSLSPEKSSNKSSSFFDQEDVSRHSNNSSSSRGTDSNSSLDVTAASVDRSDASAMREISATNLSGAESGLARERTLVQERPPETVATASTSRGAIADEVDEFDLLSSDSEGEKENESRRSTSHQSEAQSSARSATSALPPLPTGQHGHVQEEQAVEQEEEEHENSWDESMQGPSVASPQRSQHLNQDPSAENTSVTAAADLSSSRIPVNSAFDMSMPSYVSHIDSSGDANQSSFGCSYQQGAGVGRSGSDSRAPSGSEDGSQGQRGRELSVGSDDSLQNLNSAVDSLLRHRETVLDVSTAAPAPSAVPASNVRTGETDPSAPTANENAADENSEASNDELSDEGKSEDSSFSDERSSDGEESDESEGEHSSNETSGPGSFSQIDGPNATSAADSVTAPARGRDVSVVDNSWDDTSMLQSSFVSAASGSAVPAPKLNISTSSTSTAAAAPAPAKAAFKIPTLNMSSVPTNSDEREPPSDRFSSRGAGGASMTYSGRQSMVSDWDGESSFASNSQSQSLSASPQKPITPRLTPRVTTPRVAAPVIRGTPSSGPSPLIPSLQLSAVVPSPAPSIDANANDVSPGNRSRNVIGASQGSPSGRAAAVFDESTGGSVSDTSSGSSYTASSSSYLTISSASPSKPSLAASVTAVRTTAPAPVSAPASAVPAVATPAPAGSDPNVSKNLSIK